MNLILKVGLFVLVISYQFLPRKPKPSPSLRALAPPPPKPKPLLTRLRTRCTTLVKTLRPQPPPIPPPNVAQPGAHRPLRSFHLTPERRRQRDAIRKKFANSLRLNINVDRTFKDVKAAISPRTPKHSYKRMKEDEESHIPMLKPDPAVISPWSPSEYAFLQTPPPIFTASPGPMSPPPAYDPNTPLRGTFNRDAPPATSATPIALPLSSQLSVSASDLGRTPHEVQSLIEEVQSVIEYTREWTSEPPTDPFVVGDIDSDDGASDTSSVWDANL